MYIVHVKCTSTYCIILWFINCLCLIFYIPNSPSCFLHRQIAEASSIVYEIPTAAAPSMRKNKYIQNPRLCFAWSYGSIDSGHKDDRLTSRAGHCIAHSQFKWATSEVLVSSSWMGTEHSSGSVFLPLTGRPNVSCKTTC